MLALTGASGFVGGAIRRRLAGDGTAVRLLARADMPAGDNETVAAVGDFTAAGCDFAGSLAGVSTVVHAAAANAAAASDDDAAFQAANVGVTARLAEAAAQAGVRRIVLLSSIKARGERSHPERPLKADEPPEPEDAYGRSKLDAERVLREACERHGIEGIALRAPLVYGPGVTGNFRLLLALAGSGMPLPFGAIRNRRSLIHVDNLADAVVRAATAPFPGAAQPAFAVYQVKDDADPSTPELLRGLAAGIGRRPVLLPVPAGPMFALARALGRAGQADRLLGSLVLDDAPFRRDFGWRPPVAQADGLAETARWFRDLRRAGGRR